MCSVPICSCIRSCVGDLMNGLLLMIGYTVLALLVALCVAAMIVGNRDDDWPQ